LGAIIFLILLILKLLGATSIPWIAVFLIPLIPFTLVILGLIAIPVIAIIGFTMAVICDVWRKPKPKERTP